jgi:hypothetical protein
MLGTAVVRAFRPTTGLATLFELARTKTGAAFCSMTTPRIASPEPAPARASFCDHERTARQRLCHGRKDHRGQDRSHNEQKDDKLFVLFEINNSTASGRIIARLERNHFKIGQAGKQDAKASLFRCFRVCGWINHEYRWDSQ